MKREYEKPEIEVISLVSEQEITNDDFVDGLPDVESNTLFD